MPPAPSASLVNRFRFCIAEFAASYCVFVMSYT